MDRKITITIGEKRYELKAGTPEMEEVIRKAAVNVNRKLTEYQTRFPKTSYSDILSVIALNENINSLKLQQRIKMIETEADELQRGIEGYLENTDKI